MFHSGTKDRFRNQRGQTNVLVVLALGTFLMGFIGFAVDYANLWFHRQNAQAAADASCQACAMDLLVNATNGGTLGGFTAGTNFNCSANPTAAPCQYAALNGYAATGLTANTPSTEVKVTFPGSIAGATPPPSTLAPVPYVQVNVVDRTQVFFSGLISGKKTEDVGAVAGCGLALAKSPIPIIVLNPTCSHAFEVSGSATLNIIGGPTRSVQVNSSNQSCAAATDSSANACGGNGTVDLSKGGPNFSGSSFGSFGGPSTVPKNFNGGTGGIWSSPASPIADPFSQVPAPTQPTGPSAFFAPVRVNFHVDGCPDNKGCAEFFPGFYDKPITVKGCTAIFVPGIYYIKPTTFASSYDCSNVAGVGNVGHADNAGCGAPSSCTPNKPTGQCKADLLVDTNGVVRPSTGTTHSDGHKGVMFYFSGTSGTGFGSAVINGGLAGQATCPATGSRCIESLDTTTLNCDGTAPDPKLGIPSKIDGNILVAQCTAQGTYVGAGTDTFSTNGVRGLLMFQDHANNQTHGQMNMQGNGGFALAGTIYGHASDNSAFIQLQGTPGSGTYLLGEIVADELVESGNGAISMQLNPKAVYQILKAQLMR